MNLTDILSSNISKDKIIYQGKINMSLEMIYDIPLYYISFKRKNDLENELQNVGFKNVNLFKAVNGSQLDPLSLRKNKQISARSYNDLITERYQHSGIPSLGAIGCSLSHYALWKKCIEDNLDYIIIVEDDINVGTRRLTNKDKQNILDVITQDKGLFISPLLEPIKEPLYEFFGTHFYIASQSACREMIQHMFPIDIQLDYYLGHLKTLGYINLDGYTIYKQHIRYSSVQDVCIKCYLMNINPLILLLLIFVIICCFR